MPRNRIVTGHKYIYYSTKWKNSKKEATDFHKWMAKVKIMFTLLITAYGFHKPLLANVLPKICVLVDELESPTFCISDRRSNQLNYTNNIAANSVTYFFYRGHTSRLKFVFSLQLFFMERSKGTNSFSIGGFLPPTTLTTFSSSAMPSLFVLCSCRTMRFFRMRGYVSLIPQLPRFVDCYQSNRAFS